MVVGGGVIGTPTGRFCLRLCWGGVCQTAWKWGENKKIHWSGQLVPCQSTSTRVWLGFGGRWGVAKQAVWSLTVGVGRWRVGVKQHSGWVGGCQGGCTVSQRDTDRVSCSLLIFIVKHLHLFWFCVVNTFFVGFLFFIKDNFFLFHPKEKKKLQKLKSSIVLLFFLTKSCTMVTFIPTAPD